MRKHLEIGITFGLLFGDSVSSGNGRNGDRYARVCGDSFKCYTVWNDADRLDGAFPIPQIHVLDEIKELLLDDPGDDPDIPYTVKAINDWFNLHYVFKVSLDLHGED